MAVTNVAELNALVERVKKAQREYANFTQEQVDTIFRAAALAAAPVFRWLKWPLPNQVWVLWKIK